MKTLAIILFTFLFLTGVSYAELSKEQTAYAVAKVELVKIMHSLDDFNKTKSILGTIPLKSDNGKMEKAYVQVQKKCSKLFSIANTFSEPVLLNKCKEWGWFPNSQQSH